MLPFFVHSTCPCPCCMTMSMLHVFVHAAHQCPYPFCMSMFMCESAPHFHTQIYYLLSRKYLFSRIYPLNKITLIY
jgi:hypothetical protein